MEAENITETICGYLLHLKDVHDNPTFIVAFVSTTNSIILIVKGLVSGTINLFNHILHITFPKMIINCCFLLSAIVVTLQQPKRCSMQRLFEKATSAKQKHLTASIKSKHRHLVSYFLYHISNKRKSPVYDVSSNAFINSELKIDNNIVNIIKSIDNDNIWRTFYFISQNFQCTLSFPH